MATAPVYAPTADTSATTCAALDKTIARSGETGSTGGATREVSAPTDGTVVTTSGEAAPGSMWELRPIRGGSAAGA